jgi:hypothetical protein
LRNDSDNSIGPEGKCLHFITPSPKVNRHQDRNHRQRRTKLGGNIPSLGVEHSERIKEPLDERIVSGVQEDAGPNTPGLQTHRRPEEVDCSDGDGEERQVVPDRSRAAIRTEQENGVVPEGPNDPGNEGSDNEAVALGEFGHKESTPAYFFAQDGGKVLDNANRGREKEIERDICPLRKRAESKVLGDQIK